MTPPDYLLTFELSKEKDELDIFCDEKGLEALISILSRLRGKVDHEHLMTPSRAGNELSEDQQNEDSYLLNSVTIRKR